MNSSPRRHFLRKSTLVTLGAAAATGGIALGETAGEADLKLADRELAGVLRTYGRTRQLKQGGFENVRVGAKTKRFPVARLGVDVRDHDSFRESFQKLAGLSERVLVEGNKVSFVRGGHYFVIENHLA